MVKWLNAFPSKGEISEEMSPETIVTGAIVNQILIETNPFWWIYNGIYKY